MTQFCKTIGLILVAAGFLPAFGKTVAWYRLDGFAPGVATTADTVIENSANPGVLQGKCYSTPAGDKGNSDIALEHVAALMPRGVAGLPTGFVVCDPISGQMQTAANALRFGVDELPAKAEHSDGSVIMIDTGSDLQLTNTTIEVIYRPIETFCDTLNFSPMVTLKDAPTSEGFTFGFGWTGKLSNRFATRDIISGATGSDNVQAAKVVPSDNAKWHHAAFTVDAAGNFSIYYDYSLSSTKSLAGKQLRPYVNTKLAIGSHCNRRGRTFHGDIIAVRISDVALGPAEFLKITRTPSDLADKTVVLAPLDSACDPGNDVFSAWSGNTAAGPCAVPMVPKRTTDAPVVAYDTVEKAGAFIRPGVGVSDALQLDVASTHFGTNAEGKAGNGLTLLYNPQLENGDFTIEGFFKTPGRIPAGTTWTLFRSAATKIALGTASGYEGKILFRGFTDANSYDNIADLYDTTRIDDGFWHHVALAYDATEHVATLYVDSRKASKPVVLDTAGTRALSIGWQNDFTGSGQYFPGWMDHVRVVKKALSSDELLQANAEGVTGTLAQVTFENADYSVEPLGEGWNLPGEGVARSGGSAPAFVGAGFPSVALDGKAKLELRDNAKSLALAGGMVKFPQFPLLQGQLNFTAEWFMKLTDCPVGADILRLNWGASVFEGGEHDPVWRVYVTEKNGMRMLRMKAWAGNNGIKDTPNWEALPTGVDDGRWHHYAITVGPGASSNKSACRLYRDYQLVGSVQEFTGKLTYPTELCGFTVGGGGNVTGLMDELRLTAGVLSDSFMRRAGGLMIIVK